MRKPNAPNVAKYRDNQRRKLRELKESLPCVGCVQTVAEFTNTKIFALRGQLLDFRKRADTVRFRD